MRIRQASPAESGNILLATVIIISIIGTTLAAYLTLVSAQHRLTHRSQTWNSVIPSGEAGVEEALAHLNKQGGTTNRAVDGWSTTNVLGTNFFYRSRNLGESRYEILVTDDPAPTIHAFAYGSTPTMANEVNRHVIVTTRRLAGMWMGMVAKGGISLGPGSTMDSYNSGDPRYNTNGKYDPAKAKDKSFVGSVNGDVVSSGSGANIFGNVGTGPNGNVTGVNVGSAAYLNGGGTGIQPGRYNNDLSLSFPDVVAPFSSGSSAIPGTVTETTFTYTTNTVTSATYPSPAPAGGVTTNSVLINTNSLPSPSPAGVTTNLIANTSTNWPGVAYAPITTNTTAVTGAASPPALGTYVPPLNTVVNTVRITGGGPPRIVTVTTYSYNQIDDYTYNRETYSYRLDTYTYSTNAVSTNTTSTRYALVLGSGNYMNNSVSLNGNQAAYVQGDAVWYVPGDFSLGGNAQLIIAPGASLQLYVGGAADFRGNGVANVNESALSFQFWGMPTCTSVSLNGNGEFTGTMYAPNATLYGRGGGSDVMDHSGAAVMSAVEFNGHYSFHYDELLGDQDDQIKYHLASWEEYMADFQWSR